MRFRGEGFGDGFIRFCRIHGVMKGLEEGLNISNWVESPERAQSAHTGFKNQKEEQHGPHEDTIPLTTMVMDLGFRVEGLGFRVWSYRKNKRHRVIELRLAQASQTLSLNHQTAQDLLEMLLDSHVGIGDGLVCRKLLPERRLGAVGRICQFRRLGRRHGFGRQRPGHRHALCDWHR